MPLADRLEIVVAGHRQAAMPTPASGGKRLPWKGFLLEQHDAPPLELPDHWIPFHLVTVAFCSKPVNRFWFESGRERSCVFPNGSLGITSPCELRGFRTDTPTRMITVAIEGDAMRNIVPDSLHGRDVQLFQFESLDDPEIRRLVLDLHTELAAGCSAGPLRGESICTELAITLARKYSIERIRFDEYKGGLSKARVRRVLEYIDSYLNEGLTVEELAPVAGLSRYHFGKMFKESTNTTIHQYVLSRRIQRARDLLANRRYSLADIALAAGFPSQSHFTTVFSSRIGLTPAAYRSL